MDRTERFYKIEELLRQRKAVSFAALQAELEVSRSTLKRDLEYLRTRMHAPIVWDREAGGYRQRIANLGIECVVSDSDDLFVLPEGWRYDSEKFGYMAGWLDQQPYKVSNGYFL